MKNKINFNFSAKKNNISLSMSLIAAFIAVAFIFSGSLQSTLNSAAQKTNRWAGISVASAAPTVSENCELSVNHFCNPIREKTNNIVDGMQILMGYILGLIGSISLLFIVIAGIIYMTSAGNEERTSNAKNIFTSSITGVALSLLAYSFLQIIVYILNR